MLPTTTTDDSHNTNYNSNSSSSSSSTGLELPTIIHHHHEAATTTADSEHQLPERHHHHHQQQQQQYHHHEINIINNNNHNAEMGNGGTLVATTASSSSSSSSSSYDHGKHESTNNNNSSSSSSNNNHNHQDKNGVVLTKEDGRSAVVVVEEPSSSSLTIEVLPQSPSSHNKKNNNAASENDKQEDDGSKLQQQQQQQHESTNENNKDGYAERVRNGDGADGGDDADANEKKKKPFSERARDFKRQIPGWIALYFKKLVGRAPTSTKNPTPMPHPVDVIMSFIVAFVGIGVVWEIHQYALAPENLSFIIGSFGASAVLIFGEIKSPLAQPRNFVLGHLISALVGVVTRNIVESVGHGFLTPLSAPFAVATSIVLMQITKTVHPPGGATALIAVTGPASPWSHFLYVLLPVLSGCLVMLIVALLLNNIVLRRTYPLYWW